MTETPKKKNSLKIPEDVENELSSDCPPDGSSSPRSEK